MELKLSHSPSLPTAIFNSSAKHFTFLAQRWKLDFQRISWKSQDISEKLLVHVVKEDETLSSISKLCRVPVLEIAAASKDKTGNVNIPSAIAGIAQVCHFGVNKFHESHLPNATHSLESHSRQWTRMIFTVTSLHRLPPAKTTGFFLVLVPLIALCIRCVMGAFRNIVARKLKNRAENKPGVRVRHTRLNSMRWKTVLSDLRDPNSVDAESELDSDPTTEDHEQLHFEDASDAFTKLEDEYQQFLSECGVSYSGYWRGGSPK